MMLKVTTKDHNIILSNDDNNVSFQMADKSMFNVIQSNLQMIGGECSIIIEKVNDYNSYLILNDSVKILMPAIVAHEFYSRMIILNKTPSQKIASTNE